MKTARSAPDRPALAESALVALMGAAGTLVRDLETACQAHGITHDQYNVLRILRGAQPDGHPRGEIASRLLSRAPDVTRMLDRLVKRGLVARAWHPTNRRLSMASITRPGLALLRDVDRAIEHEHAKHSVRLSPAELVSLDRLCAKVGP